MENNEPKTIIEINNYSYENEINKLEAEIIPNTELDNLQIDHTFKINHVYLWKEQKVYLKIHINQQ